LFIVAIGGLRAAHRERDPCASLEHVELAGLRAPEDAAGPRNEHRLGLVLEARALERVARLLVAAAEAELHARGDRLAVLEAVVRAARDHLRAPDLGVRRLGLGRGAERLLGIGLGEDVAGVEAFLGRAPRERQERRRGECGPRKGPDVAHRYLPGRGCGSRAVSLFARMIPDRVGEPKGYESGTSRTPP